MTLRAILALRMAVIMAVVLGLTGEVAMHAFGRWQDVRQATLASEQMRRLLILQEKLCVERGPTVGAFGAELPPPPELAAALVEARRTTDQALQRAMAAPLLSAATQHRLREVGELLAGARGGIDRILAQPRPQRVAAEIEGAMARLAGAVPPLLPPLQDLAARIVASEPEVGLLLTAAHIATNLRNYAGLTAMQLAPTRALGQRLEPRQIESLRVLQGRVIELHHLLHDTVVISGATTPRLRAMLDRMDERFLGAAQSSLERTVLAGKLGEAAGSQSAVFVKDFLQALQTIIAVRDGLLAEADRRLAGAWTLQLLRLQITLGAGGLVILGLLAATALLQRRVILPLQALLDDVLRLAQGDRIRRADTSGAIAEITRLAAAIDVLRDTALEADAAAAGREAMLERAAMWFRELNATLGLLQTHVGTLPAILADLEGILDALRAAGSRVGVVTPDTGMALDAAARAAASAATAMAADEGALAAALDALRAQCEAQTINPETLTADMARLEAQARATLAPVAGVPMLCLAAAQALDSLSGEEAGKREAIRSGRGQILAACERVGATRGAIAGVLFQAQTLIHRLAHLTEDTPPLPLDSRAEPSLPATFPPRTRRERVAPTVADAA